MLMPYTVLLMCVCKKNRNSRRAAVKMYWCGSVLYKKVYGTRMRVPIDTSNPDVGSNRRRSSHVLPNLLKRDYAQC